MQKTSKRNIKIIDFVTIREDNLSPLYWKLGIVIEMYPGTDRKIHVAKLKTVNNELRKET